MMRDVMSSNRCVDVCFVCFMCREREKSHKKFVNTVRKFINVVSECDNAVSKQDTSEDLIAVMMVSDRYTYTRVYITLSPL